MSVIDDLKQIGGGGNQVQRGENFNQGSFRKDTISVDGVSLTGGYCAGVVLDWARRVLQSGSNRDEKYLSYSTPTQTEPKRVATVQRMAKGYIGQASSYVTGDTNKVKALAVLQNLKVSPVVNLSGHGIGVPVKSDDAELFKKFWVIPGGSGNIFEKFDLTMVYAGVLSHANIDQLINNLTAQADPQLQGGSADGRHWETFAAELDTFFVNQRHEMGKADGPKKLFSNLKVVNSSPKRDYASGGVWLHELMNHGFEVNCCSVVVFSPSAGGTGHAVAAHQKGIDEFVFFDPNFGAFRYSKADLQKCFQHLFWSPYIKAGNDVLDGEKAVYLRRLKITDKVEGRWDKMGYTIFARK